METQAYTRQDKLPLTDDGITADWLGRLLQNRYPGVAVNGLKIVERVPGHTIKLRIEVDFNPAGRDAGLPRNLCLKANLTGDPLSSPVCVNEARFYQTLNGRIPAPAPKCFYADWDDFPDRQQGLVLLEDLTLDGGEFGGSHRPISIDDMAKSLSGLAMLHGGSWGHPDLLRQDWLQQAMAPTTVTDDYWGMMETYFARHNALPERVAIFPRWMAEDSNRLRMAFRQLCAQDYAQTGPRCLVHGDAHLGNSFRRADGERIWIDWQIVRRGRPWRDYTYFVVGSIVIADRRAAEKDLLRHYLAELARHGVTIPFAEAWDEYRRWVIWGLVGWQSNINPKEETMGPLERFCRAADDLETHSFYKF